MRAEIDEASLLAHFSDPDAVARYQDGPRRFVPGLDALHRMTSILLAEHTPRDAKVLVLGAGGGLELAALAGDRSDWTFVGVDPAREMLGLAARTLGPLAERVEWVTGYIDDAPAGPFDAATCLLTLHFLNPEERRRTIAEIHRRLRPGAPLVVAHGSFPQGPGDRGRWLSRYAAYAVASGAEPGMVEKARTAVEANLATLDPDADVSLLRKGGFRSVDLFYAGFTWRGWVAYA